MRIIFVVPPIAAQLFKYCEVHKCQGDGNGGRLVEFAQDGDTHVDSSALRLEGQSLTKLVGAGRKATAQCLIGSKNKGATTTLRPASGNKSLIHTGFLITSEARPSGRAIW